VTSNGIRAKAVRRRIRIERQASDLESRQRPELRLLDATTNLHLEDDWHQGVRRRVVDNLDALAHPLARCKASAGTVISADVEVAPDGRVGSVRVTTSSVSRPLSTCVDDALRRGAFSCTSNGKPATLRLAITWPKGMNKSMRFWPRTDFSNRPGVAWIEMSCPLLQPGPFWQLELGSRRHLRVEHRSDPANTGCLESADGARTDGRTAFPTPWERRTSKGLGCGQHEALSERSRELLGAGQLHHDHRYLRAASHLR
jgi:hypothetical protein